jgi:hypothetical protein
MLSGSLNTRSNGVTKPWQATAEIGIRSVAYIGVAEHSSAIDCLCFAKFAKHQMHGWHSSFGGVQTRPSASCQVDVLHRSNDGLNDSDSVRVNHSQNPSQRSKVEMRN